MDLPTPHISHIFVLKLPSTTLLEAKTSGNKADDSTDLGNIGSPHSWLCEWFDLDKIPYERMPAEDKFWYDMVIHGQKLAGRILWPGKSNPAGNQTSFTKLRWLYPAMLRRRVF